MVLSFRTGYHSEGTVGILIGCIGLPIIPPISDLSCRSRSDKKSINILTFLLCLTFRIVTLLILSVSRKGALTIHDVSWIWLEKGLNGTYTLLALHEGWDDAKDLHQLSPC
jgi:hypothetical protein